MVAGNGWRGLRQTGDDWGWLWGWLGLVGAGRKGDLGLLGASLGWPWMAGAC